jgi:branched-chain amino acid transport system substrate-binding protein
LAAPLTGGQASLGREIMRAVTLVRDSLTTLGQKTVRIREVDTEGSPDVARAEVARAVDRWSPPIVVGSILSSDTRQFLEPLLRRGVVVLANGSSDPLIRTLPYRHPNDGFFRNWPSDDFEGRVMAEYVRGSNRADTLAILYADDPYARNLAESFSSRFRALGGVVTDTIVYPREQTRFADVVSRARRLRNQGYYAVGFPRELAALYDVIRSTQGEATKPVFSAVGIATGEFTSAARRSLTDLFYTSPALDEAAGPFFAFRESYKAHFKNETPDIVAAVTYDALWIALDAIRSKGCERDSVRKALYTLSRFDGASGPTAFDSLGDVITKPVSVWYYEDGHRLLSETRRASSK